MINHFFNKIFIRILYQYSFCILASLGESVHLLSKHKSYIALGLHNTLDVFLQYPALFDAQRSSWQVACGLVILLKITLEWSITPNCLSSHCSLPYIQCQVSQGLPTQPGGLDTYYLLCSMLIRRETESSVWQCPRPLGDHRRPCQW